MEVRGTQLPVDALQLDLGKVSVHEREQLWRARVPTIFPSSKVVRLATQTPIGTVRHIPFGIASIFTIVVANQTLRHEGIPPTSGNATVAIGFFEEGRARIAQAGRVCQVGPGDLSVIDGSVAFEVENFGVGSVTLLQLPYHLAVAKFPHLIRNSARVVPGESPEAALLQAFMKSVSFHARTLQAAS